MKKEKNFYIEANNLLFVIFTSIFATFPFIINLNIPTNSFFANQSRLYKFLQCIYSSLEPVDLKWGLYFFFIFYFFYNAFKEEITKEQTIVGILISLLFTTITMIGKAFAINNNKLNILYNPSYQILKTFLISIGYFLIYYALYRKIIKLNIRISPKKSKNKLINFFDKHQLIISIILILICWIPILYIYYPGVASGDTLDELAQFFNKREYSWSAKAIILKNNDVILNKHHSVFFTFLFGTIVKIGNDMHSYNFGMFLFIIIQTIILIASFSFLLYYMKRIKIPTWIRLICLIYICFCPIISGYTIAAIKDTLGAILILTFNIFLLQIIRNYNSIIKNKIYVTYFMINILLIFLIKGNSIFIIILSYSSLLIYYLYLKDFKKLKKLFFILLLPICIFFIYDKIFLDQYLEVTGTHKKEKYSIPFMQIARLANRNDSAIEIEDKKIINRVLNYKGIKSSYSPSLADSVKNTFKKESTDYEFEQFWKVYFKYMIKYPKVYIAAMVNSTYGYYFPEVGETEGIEAADGRLNNEVFRIKNKDNTVDYRMSKQKLDQIFTLIPFFSFFNHVAYYNWFLVFSVIYIIKKKRYKYLIPIMSLIAVLLSSLISPVNGSFRYILAIVFCVPIIISINYIIQEETSK